MLQLIFTIQREIYQLFIHAYIHLISLSSYQVKTPVLVFGDSVAAILVAHNMLLCDEGIVKSLGREEA